ncbi:MAG: DMT family transporter [Burkholderiales bacterium]|nr:MAG: DMT family transporter [Burkholderiales bacterium]
MTLAAFAQLVALSALWGASFLFIRIASPQLGPLVLAGLRIALATLTLALIMRILKHRWPWQHMRETLWIALSAVAIPFLLFAWGALHLPASYSALINTTYVIFGCLFAAWLKVDALSLRKVAGCVIGMVAISLIVQLGPMQLTPSVLLACGAALIGSAGYGLAVPLTKRALGHMEPLPVAAMTHLWSMAFLTPLAVYGAPQANWSITALLATAVMGIVTSGIAFWLHLRVMRHISSTAAMTPAFMIPVFGVLWGHLFLGEPLSSGMLAGAALALVAIALISDIKLSQLVGAASAKL